MRAIHSAFHVSMLEPATPNIFQQCSKPLPAPVIIDREPEYKISKIVDSKIDCRRACKLLYKVIWLGYKDTDNDSKWLPATELEHAKELVDNFHLKYPSKPGPLRPLNTSIPFPWLCFSTFTLLQKKNKKKILEYLYTFRSTVSFVLTCLLVFHSAVSVAIWYLYSKTVSVAKLEYLYFYTVSLAVIDYLYSCFIMVITHIYFYPQSKRKCYSKKKNKETLSNSSFNRVCDWRKATTSLFHILHSIFLFLPSNFCFFLLILFV